jgi:hypothetical protein
VAQYQYNRETGRLELVGSPVNQQYGYAIPLSSPDAQTTQDILAGYQQQAQQAIAPLYAYPEDQYGTGIEAFGYGAGIAPEGYTLPQQAPTFELLERPVTYMPPEEPVSETPVTPPTEPPVEAPITPPYEPPPYRPPFDGPFDPRDYDPRDFLRFDLGLGAFDPNNLPQPDMSKFLTKEDIGLLRQDILGSLPQPKPQELDREDIIRDIQSRINIPEVPQIDKETLIREIQSGIKMPQAPQINVEALKSDILGRVPTFDPSGLQGQISGLQKQIAGLPQPQQVDVGALRQDILSRVPQFDPSSLQQGIASLQSRIENIPQVTPRSDAEIQALINRSMQNIPQPVSYDNRIADLERRISELSMPSASPVQGLPTGRFNFGR